jgi:hypothetical protein
MHQNNPVSLPLLKITLWGGAFSIKLITEVILLSPEKLVCLPLSEKLNVV